MKELISSFYAHNANVSQQLLGTAGLLTDEQFTQIGVVPGFGSVHLTFTHLLGAEVLWFQRWQGLSPKTMLTENELPTLPVLRAKWADFIEERRASLESLDEAALTETLHWTNMRGQPYSLPRWQVMMHCATHSTHHLSELAAMLTLLGHEPEGADLLDYYLSNAGQEWKPTGKS
jgi:uncharacterized damage-inducible protein DinB